MGTIFVPTYPNIVMGVFEITFCDLCRNKFGEDLGCFIFENQGRFLDGWETLLEENKINLNGLLSILNSTIPLIQFMMEYSKDAIPFLDILIKRKSSPPEVFCKKGVLRNFAKFIGKHLCQSLFFKNVAGLRLATLLKKRLQHRCFPVNFVKFLKTPFSIEQLWWVLL